MTRVPEARTVVEPQARMVVALTHARGRLLGLEEALAARGLEVLRVPLVRTEPVETDLAPLLACPWWLFTSASAAEALAARNVDFAGRRIGAVGEATARAVRAAGGTVELVSAEGNASSLAEAVIARLRDDATHVQPDSRAQPRIGIAQGDKALPTLRERLERAGLEVRAVTVYATCTNPWPQGTRQPELIVLASPSAATALPDAVARAARLVAIGETTASSLRDRGLACATAAAPTAEAVLAAILSTESAPA